MPQRTICLYCCGHDRWKRCSRVSSSARRAFAAPCRAIASAAALAAAITHQTPPPPGWWIEGLSLAASRVHTRVRVRTREGGREGGRGGEGRGQYRAKWAARERGSEGSKLAPGSDQCPRKRVDQTKRTPYEIRSGHTAAGRQRPRGVNRSYMIV
eukprot:5433742-Pleurochrysis_carterae.AAC.1